MNKIISKIIFTLISLYSISNTSAVAQTLSPVNDESAKFDFWVGEWDVYKNDTLKIAESRIEKIIQNAVILENYSTVTGYEGKSFNFYDKEKSKWIQFWVDKNAQSISFEGNYDEKQKALIYLSSDKSNSEKPFRRRIRFFDLDSNTVRQFSERTYDDGNTWHVEYDFLYKRKVK